MPFFPNPFRLSRWPLCLCGGLLAGLAACSSPEQPTAASQPPPMGHYEGAVNVPGTGARLALELRSPAQGPLQAELTLLGEPAVTVTLGQVQYRAPQLQLEQDGGFPGHVTISALQEGDFLRGVVQLDSVRGEFVLVRRGPAAAPLFRPVAVRLLKGLPVATWYLPQDTARRHAVVVAWAAAHPANLNRVVQLARAGVATLLLPLPAGPTDSIVSRATAAALLWARRQPTTDTTRLGVWGTRAQAAEVAVAARRAAATFAVLEAVDLPDAASAQPFRNLARLRIPILGFYAGRDTSLNVRQSSQRLRQALGFRRGIQVRTFAGATPGFTVPGRTTTDGHWQWPQPTPELWQEVNRWLKQLP